MTPPVEPGEVVDALPPPAPDIRVRTLTTARRNRNLLATAAMAFAVIVASIPLLYVAYTVVSKGADALNPSFLTRDIPANASGVELRNNCAAQAKYGGNAAGCEQRTRNQSASKPGMGPAVIGTLVTTLVSAALAIPVGLLAAIYLHEYGRKNRLARSIRLLADVMTGVPSVVMGIFIYSLWVVDFGQGKSALAASLALACLMLPIVVRSSEEMLRLVPDALREGSAALGARTWKTTMKVVVPSALPGLVSGAMLAVARAAGETAPVLFTIGAATTVAQSRTLTGQSTTLSFQIYNLITNGGRLSPEMAWGAALTLILLVLVLTLGARAFSNRLTVR